MASLAYINGAAVIQFTDPKGQRKTIRLGKRSEDRVLRFKKRLELLLVAIKFEEPISAEVTEWLSRMNDFEHKKLSNTGLVQPRGKAQLGSFLDDYVAGRTDLDEQTISNLTTDGNRLKKFFGADTPMRSITAADADAFVIWMKAEGYAQATTARNIKRARQFYRAAKRANLISEDPFAHIKAGTMANDERQFFVSRDAIAKVIEQCPNREWRLIVALSRFGGLRCPSEHLALTWEDVDWERSRMTIRASKSEERVIPLFPELLPYLEECFEYAEPGAVYVIPTYRRKNINLRTMLKKIIRRAGLAQWDRPFHNMRASRETELVADFPTHVVCVWFGNSETVARRHYLTVREEDYNRAASSSAAKSDSFTHATGCIGEQATTELSIIGSKSDAMQPVKSMNTDEDNKKYPQGDSIERTNPHEMPEVRGKALQKALQLEKTPRAQFPQELTTEDREDLLRKTVRAHMAGDIE